MDGLLSNPWINMGIGLLASRGQPEGLLTGMNMYRQGAQQAQQAEAQKLRQEAMKRQIEQQQAQQEAMQRIPEYLAMGKVAGQDIAATQEGLPTIGPQGQAYTMDEQKRSMLQDVATAQPELIGQMLQQQMIPKQPDYPTAYDSYLLAQKDPNYERFLIEQKKAGATNVNLGPKLPAGYQWVDPGKPDLGVKPIKGGEKTKGTQGQNVAANYANRMVSSEGRMNEMVKSGFQPGKLSDYMAQGVPIVGNYMIDPNAQVYRQAQEDWVRAKLRKESGAVIADEEMKREIETYFPQPGDSPEAIQAKERARKIAIDSLIAETEGQYERKFGGKEEKKSNQDDPLGLR